MANGDDIEQKIKLTYETNADKTTKKVNKLDDSIEKTTESQKESNKQTKKNKQGLEDLGGGIGSTIKGFKALLVQMWAIVANPVGLIIAAIAVALTTLFKAFTSTKAGAEKFDRIMAGISATIDVVRDRVLKIASAIAKFFSGDFSGALNDAKAAVSGFGAEVAAEFKKAADATRSIQEVADAMRDLSVTRAQLDRDLAESERILTDVNATYAEKKKALEEVEIAEQKQTDAELANAKKKLEAIRVLNALSDSSSESLQDEADAQIAVIELEKKSSENRRKVAEFNLKLNNEEKTRLKELTVARQTAAKERQKIADDEAAAIAATLQKQADTEAAIRKAIQDTQDETEEERLARRKEREIERLAALAKSGVDTREALILNDQLFNELEDELAEKRAEEKAAKDEADKAKQLAKDKEFADAQAQIDADALAQKEAIEDAKIGLLGKAVNAFQAIFGKSKKAQKASLIASSAVGLAEVAINTQRAVAADIAVPFGAGLPKVPIDIASGALGAATIIASTAKGLKTLGGGSAGSASTGGGSRASASAAPQVAFQASSENQIASTISANTNELPPIQAFVLEQEVTTVQGIARNRVEENSFG